jgi:hypothetical protein
MQVTVFVERLDEQTYGAETAQPVVLVTEGRTRDEAIERLRVLVQHRLTAGEMVCLDLPEVPGSHPWVPYCAGAHCRGTPPVGCGGVRGMSLWVLELTC